MATPAETQQMKVENKQGWWWNLLPPLASALRVLRSPHPLKEVERKSHAAFWVLAALILIMALVMIVILAGDGAPFVDPVTEVWDYKFKIFVEPTPKWPVLIPCAAVALTAGLITYGASCLAGWRMGATKPEKRKQAVQLANFSALGAATLCLLAMLLIYGLGWALHMLKLNIFVLGWMSAAPLVIAFVAAGWLCVVYRRTPFTPKGHFSFALFIGGVTALACTGGALLIIDHLSDSLLKQGRVVNGARSIPTAALVQTCTKAGTDIACAVTLFPSQWQDYELIGDWEQGTTATNGDKKAHVRWQPTHEVDHVFALVPLEARKDTTVEIHLLAALVCGPQGTPVNNDDRFFFVRGRVRGEQRTAGQEMRIRIDNSTQGLGDMVRESCVAR